MGSIPKTIGKYQVLGELGRGGMGEVWKAFQPDLNRHVAIKTLLSGEQASEEFLERFQREARTLAKLSHPNMVPIYDFGAEGKLHYIVMEYVEGRSLTQVLEERRLDPDRALRIAYTVARTLQFAHGHSIVHRDIKPANILVDSQGRVRVFDFGLAKSMSEGKGLTGSRVLVGTPCYMSPEQAFGAPEEVDHRTDLYSLGAVLYEMLTGRPPFGGATVLAILRKLEEDDPPPAGVSPAVDALVLKALGKEPAKRFQTAAEMSDAIKACLQSGAPVDPPLPAPATTRAAVPALATFQVPKRWVWTGSSMLGAAFVAAIGWALWPAGGAPFRPSTAPFLRPGPTAPPPPQDLGAELRVILERKSEVTSAELAEFREDPTLRRVIAEHFLKRGQFSRALEDLKGYERAIYELASARSLQRFVSPALFKVSIAQPVGLKGPEAFLMAALGRHLEGKTDAARQKLKAAVNNGALAPHALLVRAHIDLVDVMRDPAGNSNQRVLTELRKELDGAEELYLLPLRAIAVQLSNEAEEARDIANRLAGAAPASAESFLLSTFLFLRNGRPDLASDEVDEAARMDPKNFDASILRAYVRWLEVLADPVHEKLDPGVEGMKMDVAEMTEALDDRLKHDHYPAALLLRAVHGSMEMKWESAEKDLKRLEQRVSLDRIEAGHERLAAFVYAGSARTRLLDATAELLVHLGFDAKARSVCDLVAADDVGEEERKETLRRNHLRKARLSLGDEARALASLEEALKLGHAPEDLRDDGTLGDLRRKPAFEDLLRRYEN